MKLIAAALAAILGLASAAQAAAEGSQDRARIAAVEAGLRPARAAADAPPRTITERMADLNVPGVSIAFIESGKVRWTRTYGVATAGGPPVTPDTLFQAASMSKAVAAAGALRLVEQGKLDLDEDVNLRLKSWKAPESPYTAEQKVTLRRIFSHTAGLTVSGFPGYEAGKPVPTTLQILDGLPPANTPAVRSFEAPGGRYAYSGGGYTVAQLLMVEAGGKPYPELLRDLVLRPAGMRRSSFDQPLPERLIARAASGHGVRGLVIPGGRNTYPEYAAASLWTTPSDYGRFLIALQNSQAGRPGALLKRTSAQAMMTPVDANYGLGLAIGRRGGRPYIQHGGGNAGFQCNAFAFLDGSRQGVVIMTNSDPGGILHQEIMSALAAAYGWGVPDPTTAGSPRRAPLVPPAAK
jgi:CubicO group peptidase (beta-lactamase class C family)